MIWVTESWILTLISVYQIHTRLDTWAVRDLDYYEIDRSLRRNTFLKVTFSVGVTLVLTWKLYSNLLKKGVYKKGLSSLNKKTLKVLLTQTDNYSTIATKKIENPYSLTTYINKFYTEPLVYVDGVSRVLILLVRNFTLVILFAQWQVILKNDSFFYRNLRLMQFLLVNLFRTANILTFRFIREILIIPLILSIYIWGPRSRKKRAISYLFGYSTRSIFCMFIGLSLRQTEFASYELLVNPVSLRSEERQRVLRWSLLIPFRVKRPRRPFHLWLPEAHVEGPTFASVRLAAILLKISRFGIYRFILFTFEKAIRSQQLLLVALTLLSATYSAFATLRQTDIKRIVAYSSIVHRNFSFLGFLSFTDVGIKGALLRRVGHAISSSALFIIIGRIYNRTKTKNIYYITGRAKTAPIRTFFLFRFTLGNVGFPFTLNYVAELLIIVGIARFNKNVLLRSSVSLFVSIVYSFWLFTRMSFNSNMQKNTGVILDVTRVEFSILRILCIMLIRYGVYPNLLLNRWFDI